jgi:hypothetical protein
MESCREWLHKVASTISKPLRCMWVDPTTNINGWHHEEAKPKPRAGRQPLPTTTTSSASSQLHPFSTMPYTTIICVCVSKLEGEYSGRDDITERHGWTYIQGAGDDEDNWAHGLTADSFWKHSLVLLHDSTTPYQCIMLCRQIAAGHVVTKLTIPPPPKRKVIKRSVLPSDSEMPSAPGGPAVVVAVAVDHPNGDGGPPMDFDDPLLRDDVDWDNVPDDGNDADQEDTSIERWWEEGHEEWQAKLAADQEAWLRVMEDIKWIDIGTSTGLSVAAVTKPPQMTHHIWNTFDAVVYCGPPPPDPPIKPSPPHDTKSPSLPTPTSSTTEAKSSPSSASESSSTTVSSSSSSSAPIAGLVTDSVPATGRPEMPSLSWACEACTFVQSHVTHYSVLITIILIYPLGSCSIVPWRM